MWVPRTLGGAELDPLPSLEVLDWISYGDPSAGWVLMAAAIAIGVAGAYLADDAVAELFAGDRVPVIAGQGLRPGRALVTPRRLRAQRRMELWFGDSPRDPRPHRRRRRRRRAADLRPADRAGHADRQLGCPRAARDRQPRLRDRARIRTRLLYPSDGDHELASRWRPLPARHSRHRRDLPLRLVLWRRPAAARGDRDARPRAGRASRTAGRERQLPRGLRDRRVKASRRPRADPRDLERDRDDARGRRSAIDRPSRR